MWKRENKCIGSARTKQVNKLFTRRDDIVVPWERIVKIGRDVIQVEVNPYNEIHHLNE